MTELLTALDHLRQLVAHPINEDESKAAERVLIDSIACAIGGADDEVTRSTAAALGEVEAGVGLLGSARRMRPADALQVHAAAIRCMDFNDVISRRNNQHPSEFVIPVVLALSELNGWNGRRTIDATAIGYRVFLAMGEMWEGLLGRGWAPSATLGRTTTAALVGILRDLDDKVIANAMAIAAITGPTLGVVFKGQLSHAKSLVNGMACRAGWEAIDLAEHGITGPMDAFEGKAGFNEMAGGKFLLDAGQPMLTAAAVSLKAFPTVFMIHSAIASALELAQRGDVEIKNIASVKVFAPTRAVEMTASDAKWHVRSREEAQFSLPVSIAASLVHGSCGLAELSAERLADPRIEYVLSVMQVASDEKWGGYEGGRVALTTKDGRTVEAETGAPPGHASNPMTDAQLRAKFSSLAGEVLGADRASALVHAITSLAEAEGISELMRLSRM